MINTISSVLKSREFSKIPQYYSYSSLVDTVRTVYHEGKLLGMDYNVVLALEKNNLFKDGMVGTHEMLDYLLLEAINKDCYYPVLCVQKSLCESLYNTKPFIIDEQDGIKKIPFFNSFIDRGIVLMPKEINGVKPLTSAFIFKKIEEKVIYVCCLGWDQGSRGCETIALSGANWDELVVNPYVDREYYDTNGIGFLINLLLYQDSIKDKISADFYDHIHISPKGKNKKSKTILSPRIIGAEHKPKKIYANQSNDSIGRTSPMTHWRSGHWRWQPFGKKEQPEYKTIWIEPTLINA